MKISEYIAALDEILREHGDLEVQSSDWGGSRCEASSPSVCFAKLLKGREWKPRYWSEFEGADSKGGKVCRI